MESTGIFWKSPMSILRHAGLQVWLVNARHLKNMLGLQQTAAYADQCGADAVIY